MGRQIVLAIVLLLALGCATTKDGDSRVDRQACLDTVVQAEALLLACELINGADLEEVNLNRERCRVGGEIGVTAAKLGCLFAPDVAAE